MDCGTWTWSDVVGSAEMDEVIHHVEGLGRVDALAVRDALADRDLPKVDDFGDHILIVLHGIEDASVTTVEIRCFLDADSLITIHRDGSPAVDSLWKELTKRPELTPATPSDLVSAIADVVARRHLSITDAFDDLAEELMMRALNADTTILGEVAAIRSDLARVRQSVHFQRETIDQLRRSTSPLVSEAARRRFGDVFDVTMRTTSEMETARMMLSDTLDAYRGAEARKATDVSRVLTIYAAIMLPLSLIAGIFGMNHPNLPGIKSDTGWIWVVGAMVTVALVSIGLFVALGWIRRPSGTRAAKTLGKGLIEAARTPIEAAATVLELTTLPVRHVLRQSGRADKADPRD